MAKSGKPRVSVLLAVLAVTVSLHAAQRVSAGAIAEFSEKVDNWIESLPKWMKNPVEAKGKVNDLGDNIIAAIRKYNEEKGSSSTQLPPGFIYATVTDIMVGGSTLGVSGVILMQPAHGIPFLNKEAYGQLKKNLPQGDAKSDLGAKFSQLCYRTAEQLSPITLVLAGAKRTARDFWYKQSDGSTCLAILPAAI